MRVETSDINIAVWRFKNVSGQILKYFKGKINGLLSVSNTVKAAGGGHRAACMLACVCLCAMCAVPVEAGRGYQPLNLELHIVVSYGVGAGNLK